MEPATETKRTSATSPNLARLCPACDGPMLHVAGSVAVRYDVRIAGPHHELVVSGEAVAEDGWEPSNAASCPHCGWSGTVAEVGPLSGNP